jgi:hypothetical protein
VQKEIDTLITANSHMATTVKSIQDHFKKKKNKEKNLESVSNSPSSPVAPTAPTQNLLL